MGSRPRVVNGKVLAVCKWPNQKALVLIRNPDHFVECRYCTVYEDEDSFLFAEAVVLMARTGKVVKCPEDCYECNKQSNEWKDESAWFQLATWTRLGLVDRHLPKRLDPRSGTTRPPGNYPLSMMGGSSPRRSSSKRTSPWRGSRPRNFGSRSQGS